MRILCCIVLLWLIGHNFLLSENYIKYHRSVFEAEKHIVSKDYQQAMAIYEEVLSNFSHLFFKDLHNAAVCAIMCDEYQRAYQLMKQLVLQGYELKDFDNHAFDLLKENTFLWGIFADEYPSIRKSYLGGLNNDLRGEYYMLYMNDQKAASSNDEDLMDSVFFNNGRNLYDLFQTNDFPKLFVAKDTLNQMLYVPLLHFFGLKNRMKNDSATLNPCTEELFETFEDYFFAAYLEGAVPSREYVQIVSFWSKASAYGDFRLVIDFYKEEVFLGLNALPDKAEIINKNRNQIGLFPINNDTKVLLNNSWYSQYPFIEIKEAFNNCDSCKTTIDYLIVQSAIAEDVKNEFSSGEFDSFILSNEISDLDVWINGVRSFMKNLEDQRE
ncbi:hypothetical protein [Geofilum rubicundum]|uniref:Uncharacterized protein n=1 Tax=Geofilum rubicundum JCM 15548 TaxID=1236989 RepID=A0A0E9LQR2_9BACT|nr:hypothetical protein [Geofilum rubicundum]GAO27584.1 hypothetical protein JCM15548_14419 [Geofilum rubicundum JCM 15548]